MEAERAELTGIAGECVRYVWFFLLSILSVAAAVSLSFAAKGLWIADREFSLLEVLDLWLLLVAIPAAWALLIGGMPAILAGIPAWIFGRLLAKCLGLSRRAGAIASSVPTLWCGVLGFWFAMNPDAFTAAHLQCLSTPAAHYCAGQMFGDAGLLTAQLVGAAVLGPLIAAWMFRDAESLRDG